MNDRLSADAKRRLTCFMGINGFSPWDGLPTRHRDPITVLSYKTGPSCLTHRKWASRASSPDSKGCSLEWAKHNIYSERTDCDNGKMPTKNCNTCDFEWSSLSFQYWNSLWSSFQIWPNTCEVQHAHTAISLYDAMGNDKTWHLRLSEVLAKCEREERPWTYMFRSAKLVCTHVIKSWTHPAIGHNNLETFPNSWDKCFGSQT